jgi:hypothetical protein
MKREDYKGIDAVAEEIATEIVARDVTAHLVDDESVRHLPASPVEKTGKSYDDWIGHVVMSVSMITGIGREEAKTVLRDAAWAYKRQATKTTEVQSLHVVLVDNMNVPANFKAQIASDFYGMETGRNRSK